MTMQELTMRLEWLEHFTDEDREMFWHSMVLRCCDRLKPHQQQQIEQFIRKLMEKGMTETEANQAAIEIANAMKPKKRKRTYSVGYLIEVLHYHKDYKLLEEVYRSTREKMPEHERAYLDGAKRDLMKLKHLGEPTATELLMVIGGLL